MRKYEILAIIEPKLEKSAQEKLEHDVEKKFFSKIVKKESIGLKKLAYEINKNQEGIYFIWYVETEPSKISELKRHFNLTKGFLRSVILVHEDKFPFDMKTSKEVKFPERKPMMRTFDKKFDGKRTFNRNAPYGTSTHSSSHNPNHSSHSTTKPEHKVEHKPHSKEETHVK